MATTDEDAIVLSNVLPNDDDPEGSPLTVIAINGVTGDVGEKVTLPSGSQVTLNPDGSYAYDPADPYESLAPGETAADTFTYTISDGDGKTELATVTITIHGSNDTPIANDDSERTAQDETVSDNVLPNDIDPEGDPLTVKLVEDSEANVGEVVSLPSGVTVELNANGQYTFDPAGQYDSLREGETATETFVYTVTDGQTGTAEATVTIVIDGKDDPPMAEDDEVPPSPAEDPVSDNLFGNDSDAEEDNIFLTEIGGQEVDGDVPVTLSLPSGAIMTVNPETGDFTVDPNGQFDSLEHGESATVTFEYIISDGNGGTDSAIATLTLVGANNAPGAADDSERTAQDETVSDNVLPNDIDPEGDPLTVKLVEDSEANVGEVVSLPSGVTVELNANGQYTFDPAGQYDSLREGETATETFVYTVTDGQTGTAEATVTIVIDGKDDPPMAEDDEVPPSPAEDPVSDNLFGNDSDAEEDNIFLTEIGGQEVDGDVPVTLSLPSGAIMTVNPETGDFTVDPNGQFDSLEHGESATVTFEYIISDGNGGTDSAIATLTLVGANNAPGAADDSERTAQDETVSDNVLPNDIDPEGDPLTVKLVEDSEANVGEVVSLPSGVTVELNANGQYTFDPAGQYDSLREGETATETFVYTVTDGQTGTAEATVTIVIDGKDDPPMAEDDEVPPSPAEDPVSDNLFGNDSDAESDDLTLTTIGGQSIPAPANGTNGTEPVTVSLPSGAILTVDPDNGDFTLDPNGMYDSLDHNESALVTFEYVISDCTGKTDSAIVTLTLTGDNEPPAASDDSERTDQDALVSGSVIPNDSDPEGDTLMVLSVQGEESNVGNVTELPSGALVTVDPSGAYTFDPNGVFDSLREGETATETFVYTVTDGNYGTAEATVTIVIDGKDDPPMAEDDEVPPAAASDPVSSNMFGNDSDAESDDLTLTTIGGQSIPAPANGTNGTEPVTVSLPSGAILTVDPDNGDFTLDPNGMYDSLDHNESALVTFEYVISDGTGKTDSAIVTLTLTGDNDPPMPEDDSYEFVGGTNKDFVYIDNALENDSDPDGDELTVFALFGSSDAVGEIITLPSGANVTIQANGTFLYDPGSEFESLHEGDKATDTFEYTISDGAGHTEVATVTIDIDGNNDLPMAADDTETTSKDTTVSSFVLANDSDPEDDLLQLFVKSVEGNETNVGNEILLASGAKVVLASDGAYTFDPNGQYDSLSTNETAIETFVYTITDMYGGTDEATVTVVIQGSNNPPLPEDDIHSVDSGVDSSVTENILMNDNDPDGDTLVIVAVNDSPDKVGAEFTLPSGANVTLQPDGSYQYEPAGQFESLSHGETSSDTFEYTVSDGKGETEVATVTIVIHGSNDLPGAADDTEITSKDAIVVDNVLPNDSDPENDPLTVISVEGLSASVGDEITLASGATVTLAADGSYTFDPNGQYESLLEGDRATETFVYSISDGNGGTATATVTILIEGKLHTFAEFNILAHGDVEFVGENTTYPSSEPSSAPSSAPVAGIIRERHLAGDKGKCGDLDCTRDWSDGYTTLSCSEHDPCYISQDCTCTKDPADACPIGSTLQNDPVLSETYDPSRPTMCVDVECGSCSRDGNTPCCRRFGDRAIPNALNLGSDGNAQCRLQNKYFAAYGGDLSENLCNGADLYLTAVPAGCGCIPSPTEECRYDVTQQTDDSKCFICDADDLINGDTHCDDCAACLSSCNSCAGTVSMYDPFVDPSQCCHGSVDSGCDAGSAHDSTTNAFCCFEMMDAKDSSCRASCAAQCTKSSTGSGGGLYSAFK